MNRIILIGNGFDLAHDLQTSYKNFIDHVWRSKIKNIIEKETFFEVDEDVKFDKDKIIIQGWSFEKLSECNCHKSFKKILELWDQGFYITNSFLKKITENLDLDSTSWVDVEKQYYTSLIECLLDSPDIYGRYYNKEKLQQLNKEFNQIKMLLIEYLKGQKLNIMDDIPEIIEKITSEYLFRDFSQTYKNSISDKLVREATDLIGNNMHNYSEEKLEELSSWLSKTKRSPSGIQELDKFIKGHELYHTPYYLPLKNILLLNFNYTGSHYVYHRDLNETLSERYGENNIDIDYINIHGDLRNDKNPVIFGFGDEVDESFQKIENLDNNDFLENIKSTKYHDTTNYKKLLEYIDSDQYQVFIFGHSCGLSDRTLLSTLFNHENCVSIKPFYYIDNDGKNSYSDLVRNISRHFTDKASLRDKVVNKTYCTQMDGSK